MAVSGAELSRRELLKTGAAAGAGTVGLAATAGSATAVHDGDDPLEPDLAHVAMAGVSPPIYGGIVVADAIHGVLNDSDSADRLNIHQGAMQEKEAWDAHLIQMENRLVDTATVASIEGRDALARTYEHGGSESEALSNLNERIRTFFSDAPEHNIIEIANKSLLSFHALAQDGAQIDPAFDFATTMEDGDGNGYQVRIAHEDGSLVEGATVTRHDGAEHEIGRGVAEDDESKFDEPTTIACEVWDGQWDNDTSTKIGEFTPMSDEVIDGYDSSTGEFTISVDGTELTGSILINIPNVGDPEETGASSENIYSHGELVEILTEIQNQSDTVVGNYDQTFIGEIYTLMDEGTIDPNDVRGSEGMARFLSGTDDASESRFQLALAQQLGVERADLSDVASMTVEFDGFTGRNVVRADDGSRSIYPASRRPDAAWQGQLFADLSSDQVVSGGTYTAQPTAFVGQQNDTGVTAIDAVTGDVKWTFGMGNWLGGVAATDDSELVFAGGYQSGVVAIDRTDGSEVWTNGSDDIEDIATDSAGSHAFATLPGSNSVVAIDASDGSEAWTYGTSGIPARIQVSADDSTVFVATDGGVHAINASDGSEKWGQSITSGYVDVAQSHDGETLVAISDNTSEPGESLKAFDTSDGSVLWTIQNLGRSVAFSKDDSLIITGDGDGNLTALNADDQSEAWSSSPGSSNIDELVMRPDGGALFVAGGGDGLFIVDPSDGSVISEPAGVTLAMTVALDHPWTASHDGTATNATFFDSPNAESRELTGGTLTVEKITDADGNELDSTDYNEPDYDSYNSEDYAEYINYHTEIQETLYEETTGITIPPSDELLDWLANASLFGIPLWLLGGGALAAVVAWKRGGN